MEVHHEATGRDHQRRHAAHAREVLGGPVATPRVLLLSPEGAVAVVFVEPTEVAVNKKISTINIDIQDWWCFTANAH